MEDERPCFLHYEYRVWNERRRHENARGEGGGGDEADRDLFRKISEIIRRILGEPRM